MSILFGSISTAAYCFRPVLALIKNKRCADKSLCRFIVSEVYIPSNHGQRGADFAYS